MPDTKLPITHLLLVFVICLVWGGNFTAGALGMEQFPPMLFMILRFSIVLVLLFPFFRLPPRQHVLRLLVVCLSMGTLHFTVMFWALSRSLDVSSVVIVQHMYIPIAVLLAVTFVGDRVGWKTFTAVMFSFAGVLVVGLDPMVLTQVDVLMLTLVSATFQAVGSVYQRGITGVSVFNFQVWTALISLPALALCSWIFETGHAEAIITADWRHWAAVIYSAILASIVGHGLFFYLVQRHPVSVVMPYLQMTPILGVGFGILLWGDRPGWRLLAGGLMVLAGILFITLRASKKAVLKGTPEPV